MAGRSDGRGEEGRTRLIRGAAVPAEVRHVLRAVQEALAERGHDPVRQLTGYLLSGDPAYITAHRGARALIRRLEREELMEELVRAYLRDRGRPT